MKQGRKLRVNKDTCIKTELEADTRFQGTAMDDLKVGLNDLE